MSNLEPESAANDIQHEIEHGHESYTDAELLEHSQLNAQAFVLAVFDAIGDDQAVLSRVIDSVANTFASGWDVDRKWQPTEILDALLTNYRSVGAAVESYDPNDAAPSAVLTGLPDPDLAAQLQVTPMRFRPMLAIGEQLAARLGCNVEWSHDTEGRVRLTVERTT